MPEIKTMTLHEVVTRMRALGLKTGPQKVGDGIENGAYPFGVMIRRTEKSRCFEIYEKDFNEWVATKLAEN